LATRQLPQVESQCRNDVRTASANSNRRAAMKLHCRCAAEH
jgi:hypothetical protein